MQKRLRLDARLQGSPVVVHVHAWVCAGDGLLLRPSSMSVQVRACVRVRVVVVAVYCTAGSTTRRPDAEMT
jgi:hypothetical protein